MIRLVVNAYRDWWAIVALCAGAAVMVLTAIR